MQKVLAYLVLLLLPLAARGQALSEWYYWFDTDEAPQASGQVSDQKFRLEADVSNLSMGAHSLFVQVADTAGVYSPPIGTWFYHVPDTRNMDKLYYWVGDENVMHSVDFGDGKFELDVSGIATGIHSLNLQVMDKTGCVSAVDTYVFYKVPASAKVEKLRYWIDAAQDMKEIAYGQNNFLVDVSECSPGFHFINYYVVDDDGKYSPMQSAGFYRVPLESSQKLYYWFAGDTQATEVKDSCNGFVADVTRVQEGFNTMYIQFVDHGTTDIEAHHFIKVAQTEGSGDLTVACVIDGKLAAEQNVSCHGGVIKLDMDVSNVEVGMHKALFQVITPSGVGSTVAETYFIRTLSDADVATMKCSYTIDGFKHYTQRGVLTNGTFHFDLPVDDVEDGLHRIDFVLVAENGDTTTQGDAWFFKTPVGGNGITQYDYWLNEKADEVTKVTLTEYQDPFQLVKLLPVPSEPIRSSVFHFEVKDGIPMMYAKNDIHFRFHDRTGRWVDESKQYVDYNTSAAVTDAEELKKTQTFTRPEENRIKWFTFESAPGDTIGFKSSQATSLQVFAPSGKEILSALGDKSVQYTGAHTWETGTYYVAVHDVTGSKPNITLDYMHMDKYDVVDQDVRVVGNGGCSTITFQGNGFRDLYAVDLRDSKGNVIESIDVGHESDATTTVTFDFTGAKLGKYNAVFHFTDEDKTIANCITIEEAKDIELVTKVTYPSTFLRGRSVTYIVDITNTGNTTAYDVPTYVWIKSREIGNITSIKIEGLNIKKIHEYFDTSNMSVEDLNELMTLSNQYTDDLYFNRYKTVDSKNPSDSVCVRSNYFFANIAPHETKTVAITITSNESDVQAYVAVPEEWPSLQRVVDSQGQAKAVMFAGSEQSGFNYCCIRNQVECVLSIATIALDVTSVVSSDLGVAVLDCVVGSLNALTSSLGSALCGDNDVNFDSEFRNTMHKNGVAASIVTSFMSCVAASMNPSGKLSKLSKLLSQLVVLIDIASLPGNTSCLNITTFEQPGCSLTPPHGGTSRRVNSYDPNDIYGYTAPSGSMFVGEDVVNLPYRIEFENDTTFASSPAHTVVIKDTLDAMVYDLSSYQPTSIKIGDKNVQLSCGKTFVTTVDMRPEINAIVQVEGLYDEQKGIATWHFTSLDPMTMEPTDDIMQGFLPVNYDGSGIGEVAYRISRKVSLPDGTEVSNKASIIFDNNDAIETPVWTNIIDAVLPVSHVSEVEQMNDTIVRIHFEGDDARSGVWKYALYVQYGEDSSWNQVAETDTTCFDFQFFENIDYGFCVVATDSAGNVEKKIIRREYRFLNGEGEMIEGISLPQEDQVATNRAYDLSGQLIQEEGYRGIIVKNRKKLLKR